MYRWQGRYLLLKLLLCEIYSLGYPGKIRISIFLSGYLVNQFYRASNICGTFVEPIHYTIVINGHVFGQKIKQCAKIFRAEAGIWNSMLQYVGIFSTSVVFRKRCCVIVITAAVLSLSAVLSSSCKNFKVITEECWQPPYGAYVLVESLVYEELALLFFSWKQNNRV